MVYRREFYEIFNFQYSDNYFFYNIEYWYCQGISLMHMMYHTYIYIKFSKFKKQNQNIPIRTGATASQTCERGEQAGLMKLRRGSMPRKRTGGKWCNSSRPATAVCNVAGWLHSIHWPNGPSWGGGVGLSEKYVFCVPRELHRLLSLFCLWEKLNGGENSLHWKENMLPLFNIMTLWSQLTFPFEPVNITE